MVKCTSLLFGALTLATVLGCGSGDAAKPSTADDVAAFKGNPTSPAVQQAIRAHFGGPPAVAAPPAAKGG